MKLDTGLAVVYERGVLRPEERLDLPERTRLIIAVRRVETTPESESHGRQRLHEIRRRGDIRLAGWRPTRAELHERG